MAYLSPPFILCPLSERKDLLGMREDRSQDKAIITIGKNIAIQYHILEQKQDTSWTSSRHWLTSPVVYCSDFERYGAVIDHCVVALWKEEDKTLSQLKKFKFADNVAELRPTQTMGTLVVFCNGSVFPLDKSDDKEMYQKSVIDINCEVIVSVDVDEKSRRIFIVSGKSNATKKVTKSHVEKRSQLKVSSYVLPPSTVESSLKTSNISEEMTVAEIVMDKEEIIGHCTIPQGNDSCLLYICSDGYLYRKTLLPKANGGINLHKSGRGLKVAFMAKSLSKTNAIVMKVLEDCSSLIVYGCDPSEEGAVVFIYDINYDLLLSKQSLKLYASPPIMDVIGHSVFVPVGLHVLVMNFRVKKSLLASVVGQHQLRADEEAFVDRNPWGVKDWELDVEYKEPGKMKQRKMEAEKGREVKRIKAEFPTFYETILMVKSLESDGQPELIICQQTVLPAVETKNFDAIEWLLNYFDDVPEMFIVKIATLYLEQLKASSSLSADQKVNGSSLSNGQVDCEKYTFVENTNLNNLLQRKFDSLQLTKSLRSIDFQLAKLLVLYITWLMETSWTLTSDGEPNESAWIKWISAVLDAHYTKFVFNNEMEFVDKILNLIEDKSLLMNSIEELEPLLLMTVKKTQFELGPSPNSKFRTETIEFI